LVLAQNDLKQANISLENEIKKLETYEIKAPFDGIITRIDYQV
jgi:multidrug resistance efflux pump